MAETMELNHITRPFMSGRSQAVRIPKEFRFEDEDLVINQVGDSIMITPKRLLPKMFLSGLSMLDDDFMEDGRPEETCTVRKGLDENVYA